MRYGSISYVVAIILCKLSTSIHHAFVLPTIVHTLSTDNNIIIHNTQSKSNIPVSVCYSRGSVNQGEEDDIPNINNNIHNRMKRRIQYEYEYGKH